MIEKKKKQIEISAVEMLEAMDIVRGMSYEEIQELLRTNGLYKTILKMDEENNGIHKKID